MAVLQLLLQGFCHEVLLRHHTYLLHGEGTAFGEARMLLLFQAFRRV